MKKALVVMILVLISLAVGPISSLPTYADNNDTIKMATWNIRDLSTSSRNDFELMQISYILKDFDFVAIQEVNDPQVVATLGK